MLKLINHKCQYFLVTILWHSLLCKMSGTEISKLYFSEKKTTKCVLKVTFVNRGTKGSQGQRSSLEKKRPYHMENLGSFLITWKITNLYNSSHQVFLLLLCRTRALDRLHWFQIKYLAVRDRFAGSTHRTEDLSEDPRTDRF